MSNNGYKRQVVKGNTATSSGTTQIIAPGDNGAGNGYQRVRIHKIKFVCDAAGDVQLVNAVSTSIVITPNYGLISGVPLVLDDLNKVQSEPGDGVSIKKTGAVDVAYEVEYSYVP